MPRLTEDQIDELNEPVCTLATLRPSNDWPDDVKMLIGAARRVQKLYGFEVVTFSLND